MDVACVSLPHPTLLHGLVLRFPTQWFGIGSATAMQASVTLDVVIKSHELTKREMYFPEVSRLIGENVECPGH